MKELFDFTKIRKLAKVLQKKRVHTENCISAIKEVMPTHGVKEKWENAKIVRCAVVQKSNGMDIFFAGSPAKLGRMVLFQALIWRRENGFMSVNEMREIKKGLKPVELLRKRYVRK